MREQYLRSLQRVATEAGLIGLYQPHLPHCGSSLQLVQCVRAFFPVQALHAFGYRTGGYQYDFLSPAICVVQRASAA